MLITILIVSVLCNFLVACESKNTRSTETTTKATVKVKEEEETIDKTETTTVKESSEYKKSETYKEKVKCSICNGTGKVKYYYGDSALEAALDGKNDYEYGPCTSCDGTGYTYFTTSDNSESSSNLETCPSCGKKVESLSTKKDAAGVKRTWCSSCWSEYNSIMGN